jgi:hypothetical protein
MNDSHSAPQQSAERLSWKQSRLAEDCEPDYFTMQSSLAAMTNLYKALSEISAIRTQMARAVEFRGYGPATLAITGALAFVASIIQAHWVKDPTRDIAAYLVIWIVTAAVSLLIISIEAVTRAKRIHSGLAGELVHSAVEHFLPALVAGLMLTIVLVRRAPSNVWMLPGLWQVIFSLGVFSSCQSLPRPMFAVGVWYLAAGLTCLALGNAERALSPWSMGIAFGIGQLLVALVLQVHYREADEKA